MRENRSRRKRARSGPSCCTTASSASSQSSVSSLSTSSSGLLGGVTSALRFALGSNAEISFDLVWGERSPPLSSGRSTSSGQRTRGTANALSARRARQPDQWTDPAVPMAAAAAGCAQRLGMSRKRTRGPDRGLTDAKPVRPPQAGEDGIGVARRARRPRESRKDMSEAVRIRGPKTTWCPPPRGCPRRGSRGPPALARELHDVVAFRPGHDLLAGVARRARPGGEPGTRARRALRLRRLSARRSTSFRRPRHPADAPIPRVASTPPQIGALASATKRKPASATNLTVVGERGLLPPRSASRRTASSRCKRLRHSASDLRARFDSPYEADRLLVEVEDGGVGTGIV